MTTRIVVLAAVVLVLLASAAVRLVRLDTPSQYIFDEVYYAKDATFILDGKIGPRAGSTWLPGDEVSWPHPYYGDLAIAGGIALFGDNAFGWRFVPALAGIALLALVYPIARRLGLRRPWSLAALVLAAADILGIAQSRIATLDIFVALWTVLTIYLVLRFVQGRGVVWLVLAGITAGLAVGTKWSGALAMAAALVLIAVLWRPRPEAARRRQIVTTALLAVACLVILPAALYFASYIVYFTAGHSLADWWHLQREMWTFNMNLAAEHTYASLPPTWILDVRPVWYAFDELAAEYFGVVAMGHPVLWWTATAALVALPVAAIVDRRRALVLPALIVALLYFPWFAATRTSFIYYMMPVAPFLAILVASGLARLSGSAPRTPDAEEAPGRRRRTWRRAAADAASAGDLPADDPSADDRGPAAGEQTRLVWTRGDEQPAPVTTSNGLPVLATPAPADRREPLGRLLGSAAVFLAAAAVAALFWWPIARLTAVVFYEWPASVAPPVGIAVATIAGAGVLVMLVWAAGRPRLRGFWRHLCWAYCGAMAGLAVAFAPVVLYIGTDPDSFYRLMWLPTWI